jgi:hypothetical protein
MDVNGVCKLTHNWGGPKFLGANCRLCFFDDFGTEHYYMVLQKIREKDQQIG